MSNNCTPTPPTIPFFVVYIHESSTLGKSYEVKNYDAILGTLWRTHWELDGNPLRSQWGTPSGHQKNPQTNMSTKQTKCTHSVTEILTWRASLPVLQNQICSFLKSFCRPRRWVGVGRRWSDPFPGAGE
jgi:hypothetical protein